MMVHKLTFNSDKIQLPERFTFPFCYEPHPLVMAAAEEVCAFLEGQSELTDELRRGKMFGVLVVKNVDNSIGFLAAYSGNLNGRNDYPYFVPPIYDMLDPKGFFKVEETEISNLNHQVLLLQHKKEFLEAKHDLEASMACCEQEVLEAKRHVKQRKIDRDLLRMATADAEVLSALTRESQHDKAELKRFEKRWKERIEEKKQIVDNFSVELEDLKQERKQRSAELQRRLFDQFQLLNHRGECKPLTALFENLPQGVPPAGAGECAGPKLLQYAYLNRLLPLAMGEFWWGDSPKSELRIHRHFYPACKGKCEPILGFMLQGLSVDPNPLMNVKSTDFTLPVVYEDEWLLAVNKPSGMLSAPGKVSDDSVYDRMKKRYPEATGPLLVHRLDMDTSGILLIAKTKEVHARLQALFESREVFKEYRAWLDGVVDHDEGEVALPLILNPMDRPRQMVDWVHGKPAMTRYKVLGRADRRTYVAFYPQTGRTHQLRVHAAHVSGLNAPIVGDPLYGIRADRLYLHAAGLKFIHPITGKWISISVPDDF